MPGEEDPVQLGREIRFFLTTQMGNINHRKMEDLLTRFLKCWKPTWAYHEMIAKTLKNMRELHGTKEYNRLKLVDTCKHLLPPDGYVQCVGLMHQSEHTPRMREHAVEDTRIRMHKLLMSEVRNSTSNNSVKYQNCGELKSEAFLRYFNMSLSRNFKNPMGGNSEKPQSSSQNNKKREGGSKGSSQDTKKPKVSQPTNSGQNKKFSKSELHGLISELKKQGLTFPDKKGKSEN